MASKRKSELVDMLSGGERLLTLRQLRVRLLLLRGHLLEHLAQVGDRARVVGKVIGQGGQDGGDEMLDGQAIRAELVKLYGEIGQRRRGQVMEEPLALDGHGCGRGSSRIGSAVVQHTLKLSTVIKNRASAQ